MKLGGTQQLLTRGSVTRLMRAVRLNRINYNHGKSLSEAEANALRRDFEAAVRRLKRLRAGHNKSTAWHRAETKRLFNNLRFQRAVALIQSIVKDEVLTHESAANLAERAVDLAFKEKVRRRNIDKASGGKRTIVEQGPVQAVRNRALALIIEAVCGPFEFEFCQFGRGGVHAAVKRIGESLSQGYRFWVTCDLVNAYPSVKMGHVKGLIPVHGQLLRDVGFPIHLTGKTTYKEWGRPGLAEGATHSSKILSVLTDGVFRQLDENYRVLCYADNVAIGAHTLDEAMCALDTFKNAMSAFSAGPIHLHQISVCDGYAHHDHEFRGDIMFRNAVDFCQYRASFDRFDGTVRYRPNTLAFHRARREVFTRLPGVTSYSKREQKVDAYLKTWANSFRLWKRTELTEECLKQTRDRWLHLYETGKTIDAA